MAIFMEILFTLYVQKVTATCTFWTTPLINTNKYLEIPIDLTNFIQRNKGKCIFNTAYPRDNYMPK